jgi:hypothetical protein
MKTRVLRFVLVVLLVLTAAAWLLTSIRGAYASYYRPGAVFSSGASAGGVIYFSYVPKVSTFNVPKGLLMKEIPQGSQGMYFNRDTLLPFLISFKPYQRPGFSIFVPYWLVILVQTMLLALVLFWIRRRRRTGDAPMCAKCGYNLTGNVSGICPECGERI